MQPKLGLVNVVNSGCQQEAGCADIVALDEGGEHGADSMAAWTAGATSGFAQPMDAHQGAQAAAPFALALRPPPAGALPP